MILSNIKHRSWLTITSRSWKVSLQRESGLMVAWLIKTILSWAFSTWLSQKWKEFKEKK